MQQGTGRGHAADKGPGGSSGHKRAAGKLCEGRAVRLTYASPMSAHCCSFADGQALLTAVSMRAFAGVLAGF